MRKVFGYKHWTLEESPRCFYVGKGLEGRAEHSTRRSRKWHAVVNRYGLRVEVCIGPVSDEEAIEWEIKNISLEDTFTTSYSTESGQNIRCNFTRGGDGAAGYRHTAKHKAHISNVLRGNRHTVGRNRPESERYAIRVKQQILTRSDVVEIQRLASQEVHYSVLQERFKCSYSLIRRAIRGTYEAHK